MKYEKKKSKTSLENSNLVRENAEISASSIPGEGSENFCRDHQFFDNHIAVEWLTTHEAAAFLRVTPNALRIMVHRRRVKFYKIGTRLRFRLRDLEATFSLREDICRN